MFSFSVWASGTVILNGKVIKNKEDLHKTLAKGLHFPLYYGNNLDALYDILVNDTSAESVIKLKSIDILKARVGHEYLEKFVQTINDASEENPRVILVLE